MSNFVIFEDQENLHETNTKTLLDGKKERQKLAPLTNKGQNNENALENQVKKCLSLSHFKFIWRAFCLRNSDHKSSEAVWIFFYGSYRCTQTEKCFWHNR